MKFGQQATRNAQGKSANLAGRTSGPMSPAAPILAAVVNQRVPFQEAVDRVAGKVKLPTTLGHRQIMELDKAIRDRSLWSAQVSQMATLERIGDAVELLANGDADVAEQRLEISRLAESLGEPLSDAKINLVLRTQLDTAYGYAQKIASFDPDIIDMFPAWRLVRWEGRIQERDWAERWELAAEGTPEEGRNDDELIALKAHPIWERLGSAEVFDDALDADYPPFAFNSGMGVEEIDREEAEAAGVIARGQPVPVPDKGEWEPRTDLDNDKVLEAILDGHPELAVEDGVLVPREEEGD